MPGSSYSVRIEKESRLRAKFMAIASDAHKAAILKANQKSADEFMALVRTGIPEGTGKVGHLSETLRKEPSGEVGAQVVLGDENSHPYPFHLEAGHRLPDGTHVPGKPFWWPAKRILKKRAHSRIVRAERAVIKSLIAGAGGG
jgi:hypothetical protein